MYADNDQIILCEFAINHKCIDTSLKRKTHILTLTCVLGTRYVSKVTVAFIATVRVWER